MPVNRYLSHLTRSSSCRCPTNSTIVYGFTVNTGSPSCCTDDRPSISLLEVTPRLRGLADGEHPRDLTAPLVCSSFFIIPMLRHRNSVHQSKTLRREVMEICGHAHLFDRHRARPSRSCLQSISSEWAYIRGAECLMLIYRLYCYLAGRILRKVLPVAYN